MAADTPYIAQVRLKWGDGFIQPGEPVPADSGRNYQLMLTLGEIAFVGTDGNRPHVDERPHSGSQKREQAHRSARSAAAKKQ